MGYYGHDIHTTLSGFINGVPYPCELPLYYFDDLESMTNGKIKNVSKVDVDARVRSRVTISAMIDMVDRTIPFRILKDDDIITIYEYLNEYVHEMDKYLDVPDVADYSRKSKVFVTMLKRSIRIISKYNKRAKAIYLDETFMQKMLGK
jgi:hypothetical protein